METVRRENRGVRKGIARNEMSGAAARTGKFKEKRRRNLLEIRRKGVQ